MNHIVITGARGRIGTFVSNALEQSGFHVTRVSRESSDYTISYEELFDKKIIQQCDAIFHTAWSVVPSTAEKAPGSVWQNDLPLLSSLLNQITILPKEKQPQFIYSSSGGTVYGNALENPHTEKDELSPISWYGAGKVAGEQLIQTYTQFHQLSTCVLRISNPYGLHHNAIIPQGLISIIFSAIEQNKSVKIFGDGNALKDYIHMDDFMNALKLVFTERVQGIYNLCSGSSHSIHDVLHLIEQQKKISIQREYFPANSWDVQVSKLSSAKLENTITWRPIISLEEGLRKYQNTK